MFHQALELALLSFFYLPWLWGHSEALTAHLAKRTGWFKNGDIAVTIAFFLLDGAKDMLISLPFSLCSTFVVEQRHGFNKQTLRLFVVDTIKSVRTSSYSISVK
jgi:STE24 endopeptidase